MEKLNHLIIVQNEAGKKIALTVRDEELEMVETQMTEFNQSNNNSEKTLKTRVWMISGGMSLSEYNES